MKIHIVIDPDDVTLDDLVMVDELESGKIPATQLKSFVSRFIVDENQSPLPQDEAFKLAGKMTLGELKLAFNELSTRMRELQATAVSPTTSGD